MITVEAWTTIRYLRAQGKSVRAIARELGLARNTVRAALRQDAPPRYTRPKRPNPKLEPFITQIEEMVVQKHFIGSRVLRELRALGYQGGQAALYDYLRTFKAETQRSRLTERFETDPAQQGQFDWSPYTVPLGGIVTRVVIFCLTLAFSRRKFYWPSLDETQASVFEALEAALHYFGGSPKQLLVDNAHVFVSDASPEHFTWNKHFLELCGHYGIEPRACQPGRPRTKGKVERPFFYLEQHFIKGNAWEHFGAFARALAAFASDELDTLIHSTTGERPIDRFQAERALLTPLPSVPFIGTHEEMRKVSWDCLISFGGSRYSVPWPYAAKHVWLRTSQGLKLIVRNQSGEQIACHDLAAKKGSTNIDPSHYEGLRKAVPKTRALLEEAFLGLFPEHAAFIEGLLIQQKNNALKHLRAIVDLAEVYPREALAAAFVAAKDYNTYSHRFIRGLLEAGEWVPRDMQSADLAGPNSLTVDLQVYQQILEAGR
ncbi:MAG: IS21 family transposase [Anaerolineae bacterium]